MPRNNTSEDDEELYDDEYYDDESVIEEEEKKSKSKSKSKKSKDSKDEKKDTKDKKKEEKWKEITRMKIEVDFWKTDLHGKEIGIRQKDQQRAKSRQFSKDMDIYGSVKIDGEDEGHVGFRAEEWENYNLEAGNFPRLIVRYFSESDRWVASIEQDNIKTLALSLGYERSTLVFDVFLAGNRNVFTLEKVERGTGSMDRVFIPLVLEKEGKEVDYFVFQEKRFTIGSDWKLYRANDKDKTLVDFDSKKFNIGGKVEIKIFDPVLVKNKVFRTVVILFAALIKFWGEAKDRMDDAFKKYRKGEIPFKPDSHELDMLENPRSRAR